MDIFELKSKVVFGSDSLGFLENLKNKRVLIISDPYIVKSKMLQQITDHLTEGTYEIFSNIAPDPEIDIVVEGIQAAEKISPQAMIAVGGGSAIDAGKAIMNFYKQVKIKDGIQEEKIQFYAIPTTSGTGSEVTSFAVITDTKKGIKYPLIDDRLLPDVAILDYTLAKTVPKAIVADTGMDVLTHALEAYVSKNATDFSDAFAEKAVTLVFEHLFASYSDENNMVAKEKMHIASCMAGIAFNAASLGMSHAIAHVIGGKFHIPHGKTNGILLPYVIAYNGDLEEINHKKPNPAAVKYGNISRIAGIGSENTRMSVKNLVSEIKKLQKLMQMPTKLTQCKVSGEALRKARMEIACLALKDICMETNPVLAKEKDIIEILNKVI